MLYVPFHLRMMAFPLRRLALTFLLGFPAPLGVALAADPAPSLRIAAAADLRFALDEVIGLYARLHPEVQVQASYGSSGQFYAQLAQQAPFDLFLSADVAYPRKLVEEGRAEGSAFVYATGRLALWLPPGSPLRPEELGLRCLLDPQAKKIALANPRHAPYGRAAEAALRSVGLYEELKEHLVLGENVAQAAQFVQSGAADAGLIALSLAVARALREEGGRFWLVPQEAYPRLDQGGIILKWARDPRAAGAFRDVLLSHEGRAVLERNGFLAPLEAP